MARRVSELIDDQLRQPGAEDLSARHYPGGRVAEVDGCTFLRPTVIHCTDPEHPLAAAEFVFPFVTVVEVPAPRLLASLGPTLVATVLSDDPAVQQQALACHHIDRLNLGAIATPRITWDQPHEGSLFEHLYRQRAFQAATA